ncbi:MAG: nuclear transport factor 2 family protein [Bacteroidota bacterium]
MKKIIFFFLLLNYGLLMAQNNPEEQAIRATIDQLFDGMRAGDSTMVRSTFHTSARLQSAFYDKEGQSVLKMGSIDRFVGAVGTPHDDVWDEKIWSFKVHIDGNLATTWTDYTFFLGEKMSHCGVNAFHLFKSEEGWKITQITDTRRKENCQVD